jgi:hypothetical protein
VGVPQESVLSPCPFNFFTSDFPVVGDLLASFADDFTIGASDENLANIEAVLNDDLICISKWAKRKMLRISAPISQVTYFTPWNRENADPKVFFEGNQIPVENNMKILGVIYDIHHTFTPHVKSQSAKARSRLCIAKAVMGANWSSSKEDGLLTYRTLISPVLGYAAPVWLPARSLLKHPVAPLQAVQNSALRSITGCHAASSVQHLHDECEMLQVFDHLAMQSSQFLANTRQPNLPSHDITSRPPGPRPDRKPTLQRAFGKVVEPFSTD